MKTKSISFKTGSLLTLLMTAVLALTFLGCEKDFKRSTGDPTGPVENILASEDYWVYPEGTILITLDGSVQLDFPEGAVAEPTLVTIASVALDDDPNREFNLMDHGISITITSQDLVFGDFLTIRMNYSLDEFQRTAKVNEKYLTIYKVDTRGKLSEREVSIGECCVDCICKTVEGCISECGLYVVGELYVVPEV